MKGKLRRAVSLLLCAVLLVQMMPAVTVHVHAEETELVFTKCDPASLANGLQTGCYYLPVAIVNDGEDGAPSYYTLKAYDDDLEAVSLPPEEDGTIHLSADTDLPLLIYEIVDNGTGLFLRDGSMLYLSPYNETVVLSAEEAAALTEVNIGYQTREDGPGVGFYTEHSVGGETAYTYLVFEAYVNPEDNSVESYFNSYGNVGISEDVSSTWGFYLYSAPIQDHEHVLSETAVYVDANTCQYSCTVVGCDYTEKQPHTITGWLPSAKDANSHEGTCTVCSSTITQPHNWTQSADGSSRVCSQCGAEAANIDHSQHSYYITHVEAVAGNCTTPGNIEFWYCRYYNCQKCYSDEAMTQEISPADVVITPGAHSDACVGCAYGISEKTFELFTPSEYPYYDEDDYGNSGFHSLFPYLEGFQFLIVGEYDGNIYAMGNETLADGSRRAVNLSNFVGEDGSVTVESDLVEFFTYKDIAGSYTFSPDNGCMTVLDGNIVVHGENLCDIDTSYDVFPQPIGFEQDPLLDDYAEDKGYLYAWALNSPLILFDDSGAEPKFVPTLMWSEDENGDYIRDENGDVIDNRNHSIMLYMERCKHPNMKHTAAAEVTCTEDGAIEHWYCEDCQIYFANAEGTEYIVLPENYYGSYESYLTIYANGHEYGDDNLCDNCGEIWHPNAVYVEVEEIEPTCFEPGVGGYWLCEECGMYMDESKEHEYREEAMASHVPALGHAFNPDTGMCDNCGLANPVYSKVTSLDAVNEEDLYIIVAEVGTAEEGKKYFVLGGLDETASGELGEDGNGQGNIACGESGNAVEVVVNGDGSISLLNQNYVGNARPSEFMFDVNPEWWDLSDMGLTSVMPLLPNYCVYSFQSYGFDNTGYMGTPRYGNGEYGHWDGSAWIIDFYDKDNNTCVYEDYNGQQTHASQIAETFISEDIANGDLLMYPEHYVSAGGAMFTLRFNVYENKYYFIAGEDGFLESIEYGPLTNNGIQYAVNLYRYDVPTAAHTCQWSDWEPSEDGTTHIRTCGACGETERGEHEPKNIPAVPATCAAAGLSEGVQCGICGTVLQEQKETEKLPHTIAYSPAILPTCETHGWSGETYCDVCGVHFTESTVLPETGHRWSDWLTTKEATQTQHGCKLRYCLNGCGEFEEDRVPAYGHEHNLVPVGGNAPLCCAEGMMPYYVCTYEEIDLLGDENDELTYNDSCGCLFLDAEGTQQVTERDLIIPATGEHDLGEWVPVASELDYEEQYRRQCRMGEVCGYYETRSEPKNHEHILVAVPDAEPTCEQNGTVAHFVCTLCRCLYADENGKERLENAAVIVPTTGHKYGDWQENPNGGHLRQCTLCDAVQTAERHLEGPLPGDPTGETCAIACLLCGHSTDNGGHKYGALNACDDRWQHQQSCSHCGFELIEDHEFGAWQYEAKTGLHYRTCACGAEESTVEHLWNGGEEHKPGFVTYTCTVKGCEAEKVEFLRCMHTCAVCGKCTAEITCPDKEPCDCPDPEPLPTVEPTFLQNDTDDPNQTYLGDVVLKEQGGLDPEAKPGQEIPAEYVGFTVGIQEVPLTNQETGEAITNPYTDYVEQALTGYNTKHLFDIHLLDEQGQITEADGEAQYLIRLCLPEETVLALQKGLLRLAHITQRGTVFYGVDEEGGSCIPFYKLEGTQAWFWADKFSPFALVEPQAPYFGREALATLANKDALLYAYDQIVMGVEAYLEKITVYPVWGAPTLTIAELQMVMDAYVRDHTEHFWLDTKYSISYKKSSGLATAVKPKYTVKAEDLEEAKAEFNAAAEELLHGITPDMSEFDRQLLVHDRLAARVTYDGSPDHAHDAYGAIVQGKAVCQGYAEAFQYLLRRVDIQSFIVTGTAINEEGEVPHAWNLVQIDGQYYHTDLTWNDTADRPYHAYFNMTDHYISEDHVIAITAYPMKECVELEANYFTKKDAHLDAQQAQSTETVGAKLTGAINGASFLLTGDTGPAAFLNWFIGQKTTIFGKANLENVHDITYTYIGREALITFVAQNGQPPHICGSGREIEGKQAICTTPGWEAYYECSCGKLYEEAACVNEITNLASWKMGEGKTTAGHRYGTLVKGFAAVHNQDQLIDGRADYYRCADCGEYFTEGQVPTTWSSLTLKAAHQYGDWSSDVSGHWRVCACDLTQSGDSHEYVDQYDADCGVCGYLREVQLPDFGVIRPQVDTEKGRLKVTLIGESPVSGRIMVAVYDVNGRMLGISYAQSTSVDQSGKTFTIVCDKTGTPYKVRAFVMDTGFVPKMEMGGMELQ